MSGADSIQPPSTALKNAIRWIGETVQQHPDKSRQSVINDAVLRFDLTPRECTFLQENFLEIISPSD